MMGDVRCPMCGKPNPDELEVCQHCQARLKPLTAPLGESIRPGEEPTPKSTSELEPVLPEWLRKVRHPEDEAGFAEENVDLPLGEAPVLAAEDQAGKSESEGDWLSGLISQETQDEEEEIPDWLASLGGRSPLTPKQETAATPHGEIAQPSEMGGEETTGAEDELPAWLSGLEGKADEKASPLAGDILEERPAQVSADETDWLAGLKDDAVLSDTQPEAAAADIPDWLTGLEPPQEPSAQKPASPLEGELPDWLSGLRIEEISTGTPAPKDDGLPDWLGGAGEIPSAAPQAGDLRDWFAAAEEDATKAPAPLESAAADEAKLPDWLAVAIGETPQAEAPAEQPPVPAELPDWLSGLKPDAEIPAEAQEQQPPTFESQEMPDWLSGISIETAAAPGEKEQAPAEAEPQQIPDWLASLPEVESSAGGVVSPPPFSDDALTAESVPAFTEGESDVESAFSMEMPDWLSAIAPPEGQAGEIPALETEAEEIAPGALPSWVQAMRPVEAVIPEGGEAASDTEVVEEGPLAGLRSVLPAGPAFLPGRKPQSFGLKLQADEDQQANAALLQKMLDGEGEPKPLTLPSVLLSERLVRWVLLFVLVLAVGLPLLVRSAFTPRPSLFPDGTLTAIGVVNQLPENAAVLLVFDYEMALVGELEAVAAPVVDHLMLRGARLAIVSTTPGGPLLAERFLERTQAGHHYRSGSQYVNLGYLPGGAVGVLGFAQSPVRSMRLSVEGEAAWETPVLQGVEGISDFDAVFVLSDSVEGAQAWVEQAGPRLKDRPLVMVVSAQIEPIIRPYFDSGQVKGLVGGLEGGAAYEMLNSRPGLGRRYADSFSMGLFLTVIAMVVGGVWNLVGLWRSRQQNSG